MKKQLAFLLAAACFAAPAFALDPGHHDHGDVAAARALLKEIEAENTAHAATHKPAYFEEHAKGQHPRATVVTCADSRVHTTSMHRAPEGDLFMVRNIGNQLSTTLGSVEYGVNHLNSSLLLIIGHSKCGAIAAASGDYSTLEPAIKKELDTIKIDKGVANIDGVKVNVNNQVADALKEFDEKVKAGHLMVVGAVYDFADDMKKGAGRLNVINVNGETDADKIKVALAAKQAEHAEHAKH